MNIATLTFSLSFNNCHIKESLIEKQGLELKKHVNKRVADFIVYN